MMACAVVLRVAWWRGLSRCGSVLARVVGLWVCDGVGCGLWVRGLSRCGSAMVCAVELRARDGMNVAARRRRRAATAGGDERRSRRACGGQCRRSPGFGSSPHGTPTRPLRLRHSTSCFCDPTLHPATRRHASRTTSPSRSTAPPPPERGSTGQRPSPAPPPTAGVDASLTGLRVQVTCRRTLGRPDVSACPPTTRAGTSPTGPRRVRVTYRRTPELPDASVAPPVARAGGGAAVAGRSYPPYRAAAPPRRRHPPYLAAPSSASVSGLPPEGRQIPVPATIRACPVTGARLFVGWG